MNLLTLISKKIDSNVKSKTNDLIRVSKIDSKTGRWIPSTLIEIIKGCGLVYDSIEDIAGRKKEKISVVLEGYEVFLTKTIHSYSKKMTDVRFCFEAGVVPGERRRKQILGIVPVKNDDFIEKAQMQLKLNEVITRAKIYMAALVK